MSIFYLNKNESKRSRIQKICLELVEALGLMCDSDSDSDSSSVASSDSERPATVVDYTNNDDAVLNRATDSDLEEYLSCRHGTSACGSPIRIRRSQSAGDDGGVSVLSGGTGKKRKRDNIEVNITVNNPAPPPKRRKGSPCWKHFKECKIMIVTTQSDFLTYYSIVA